MRKWIVVLMILATLILLPYGITFSKTLFVNQYITVEVPNDTANFTTWPGTRQQAQLSSNLGVVIVNACSPSDNRFHCLIIIFAHLTPGGEVTQHVLAAIVEMKDDKEVGYLVDKGYVGGGIPDCKLVRVKGKPDFEVVVKANDRIHGKNTAI